MNGTVRNTTAKEFSVHPALIYSLITKQASGAPKALLELVMNSVDAGSTRIDIELSPKGYVIADNGKGFENRKKITDFFGTLGFPHDDDDGAFYGRFRLGRAQSFGISRSKWYSKDFCMEVDLKVDLDMDDKNVPLGYKVTDDHPFYQGCKIVGEFYNQQNVGSVSDFYKTSAGERPEEMPIIPALIKMIRYLPCDVFINGEKANISTDESAVSHQTKMATFILTETPNGVVNVYNKGVYAYQIQTKYFEGDVVSIEDLDLNIARNEAKNTCKVAKSIKSKLSALDRAIETEDDHKPTRERVVDPLGFMDKTWEMMLGMQELNAESLHIDLKRKVIVCANDQKTSLQQIAKDLSSQYHLIKNNDFEVVLFDADDLNLAIDLDVMNVFGGFIPKSMFPSKEIMDRLDYQVQTLPHYCRSGSGGLLSKLSHEYPDYLKFHCFDFSENDSYVDKCGKLLAVLISVCYAFDHYESDRISFSFRPFSENMSRCVFKPLGDYVLKTVQFSDLPVHEIKHKVLNLADHDVKLNSFEKMVAQAISADRCSGYKMGPPRDVHVVKMINDNVLAYTDGRSYINFNYNYFQRCILKGDFEDLMTTFIHEMCHNSKSLNKAAHGATFYAEYMENFAKHFNIMMISFYDELGSRIERRVESVGVEWIKECNVPMETIQKIGIHRMNNKIRAFG